MILKACKTKNYTFYYVQKSFRTVDTGKAAGQTTAVVKAGSVEQKFVISVRNTDLGNGWL